MFAYSVSDYQLLGLTRDPRADRFEISAKIPPGATRDQFRLMVQNLLIQRFKLAAHYEKKEVQGYALVVPKNGHKMKASPAGSAASYESISPQAADSLKPDRDGFPTLPPGRSNVTVNNGYFKVMRRADQTMDDLTRELSLELSQPVANATGLNGKFDFTLRWSPNAGELPEATGAALPQAVQEQLGLKLEPKKTMVDALIVSHIERKPTEN